MDKRCAQLLNRIMLATNPIKISELAKAFNVSDRTVRYDLDEVDDFLKGNGLPQLTRKPNSGIEYKISHHQKQKVLELLKGINSYNYVLTPQERKTTILTEFFKQKGYTTIEEIADILSVSRGTVVKDLREVREWLSNHGLMLQSLPRLGTRVKGCEKDIRKAIISLLNENMEIEKALNLIINPINHKTNVITYWQLKKLFQDLEISSIERSIRLAEELLKTTFTDSAYSGLVIYIALAIMRIRLNKKIAMTDDELSKLKHTKEYAVATSMAAQLEDDYDIEISPDEMGYIALHLLGGKVTETDIFSRQDWVKLQILTDEIISEIGRKLNKDFSSDEELYNGLTNHLEPTIYRLKHNLQIKNPMLQEIKNNYTSIFEAVKYSLGPLEEYIGSKIPDEEIGFITIHFGAALERHRVMISNTNMYKAVVVCSTGIGTAKLLSSKIMSKFANIKVIKTLASRQVIEFIKDKEKEFDLIISTVPTDCEDIPQIVVNPLLQQEDVSNIYKFLSANPPNSSSLDDDSSLTIENLLKIIEKNCIIKNGDELVKDIERLFNFSNVKGLKVVSQPRLRDLLTGKTIRLNVKVENWEEAIRSGGDLLVNNGFVEHQYVDEMIRNVKELGPYIVIAPGVAMPHARPEDGVKKVCMSLVTLEKPVLFNNREPVRLILTFGTTDYHSHIEALSDLINLVELSYVDKILQATDVKEVIDLIDLLH